MRCSGLTPENIAQRWADSVAFRWALNTSFRLGVHEITIQFTSNRQYYINVCNLVDRCGYEYDNWAPANVDCLRGAIQEALVVSRLVDLSEAQRIAVGVMRALPRPSGRPADYERS